MQLLHIGSDSEFISFSMAALTKDEYAQWFETKVFIQVESFTGSFQSLLDHHALLKFHQELQLLYETLQGSAQLAPIEEQITLQLSGNGRGGVTASGAAWSRPRYGNHLEFSFEIDQTFLPSVLAQLNAILPLPLS